MNYSRVLSRAWEITWRWKILWILGFLAALGSGGGGGGGGSSSYSSSGSEWGEWGKTFPAETFPPGLVAAMCGLACIAILIGIAIWVVSVIARGGLIAGVNQVEETEYTSFGDAWRAGARRFWTLFGISILAAIPLIIAGIVGAIVLIVMFTSSGFAFAESGWAGAAGIATSIGCGAVFCCGMVIVSIILQQIRIYAERAAVLEDLGWIDAFSRGWQVLRANLGPTIILWLIFLALGLLFFMIILMIMAIFGLPFAAIASGIESAEWLWAPICCGGLVAIIVAGLVSAIVQTFTSATWTLAYRELTAGMSAGAAAPSAPPEDEPAEELDLEAEPVEELPPEE
jgi:hypothetical protein